MSIHYAESWKLGVLYHAEMGLEVYAQVPVGATQLL